MTRTTTFKDHFSHHAATYAAHRPRYPTSLFNWLATFSPAHNHAWDCATGNGQAATALADHFQRVTATDASAEQLAHAQPHPRVTYRQEPAENTSLPDASCDLTIAAQAAHWFDHARFNAEVQRVLKPGGVACVWCYTVHAVTPEVDAVVWHLYTDIVGPYWPPERETLMDEYRSLPWPFAPLAAPPPAFAMTVQWNLSQLLGYLGSWSSVQRYRQATGADPVALVHEDLAAAWGNPELTKNVTWPLHLRAGRKE
jgi:SAM-dependent methyltransferase